MSAPPPPDGRVVVVTGASSGFGSAIAERLAGDGQTVVATMRRPEAASARSALERRGVEVRALDVTDAESRRALVEAVVDRHGRIDGLVNNAGVLATASIEDAPEEITRRVFDTNVFGPLELTRLVLPLMRAQGGGRVVNVTAMGAVMSTALYGAYCASKHALDALTAALDIEVRPHGMRAVSVLPGQFATAITANALGPFVAEPYVPLARALARSRAARADDLLDDLGPVADAVADALDEPDPPVRRTAGVGLVEELADAVAALERLHELDVGRAGVNRPAIR